MDGKDTNINGKSKIDSPSEKGAEKVTEDNKNTAANTKEQTKATFMEDKDEKKAEDFTESEILDYLISLEKNVVSSNDNKKIDQSTDREENLRLIRFGETNVKLPPLAKIVRIFTSSTFTDTAKERNVMMLDVYPKLQQYCKSLGYEFQVVDMRWGVRDEATTDHMTSELCMRELKACQELSTGPSFITFLGQKYGYRPFPPVILAEELDAIKAKISDSERSLLDKWFWKDENSIPEEYVLQSITDLIPNYSDLSVDRNTRTKPWWDDFESMQVILRKGSFRAFKNDSSRTQVIWKYFMAVTEEEIMNGILKEKDQSKHCYWFHREIKDLNENFEHDSAYKFKDKFKEQTTGKWVKDTNADKALQCLKTVKIPKVLSKNNMSEYLVSWKEITDDIKTSELREKLPYIDRLCVDFENVIKKMIDSGIEERQKIDVDDELIKEISQHAKIAVDKSKIFYGQDDIMEKIRMYVLGEVNQNKPLIIHGVSGCGKTSIMAKAVTLVREYSPDSMVITRFLGTTSASSSLIKVLYSILEQIQSVLVQGMEEKIPQAYKALKDQFDATLTGLGDANASVVIFLDSIDQLTSDNGAYQMKWLPKKLPDSIKIVISTLPDERFKILDQLKELPRLNDSFLEIKRQSADVASTILNAWFQNAEKPRQLKAIQKESVLKAFERCPSPLFLRLCFDEALKFKWYPNKEVQMIAKLENINSYNNMKEAINALFGRVEKLRGVKIVSHSLAYLTASQYGLSDVEIDDLLSYDEVVLDEVYQYWNPPIRRIPPMLWLRIKSDFGAYIVQRGSAGTLVNTWYHRQFIETAKERYLSDKDEEIKYHAMLASYFSGTWSFLATKPKHKEAIALVRKPNYFISDKENDDAVNYRKLSELPYHLILSKDLQLLKEQVLFNFDFLKAKLKEFGYWQIVYDLRKSKEVFPGEKEVKLVLDFFEISGTVIEPDWTQLPCQLVGRLFGNKSKNVQLLLSDARKADINGMYPSQQCFQAPGGSMIHNLVGHTDSIDCIALTADGKKVVSVSRDQTVRIWSTETGLEIKCIDHSEHLIVGLLYHNDTCIIIASPFSLVFQHMETEEIFYKETYEFSGTAAALRNDKKRFVILLKNEVSVFNCENKIPTVIYKARHASEMDHEDFVAAGKEIFVYTRGRKDYALLTLFIRKFDDKNYIDELSTDGGIKCALFVPTGDMLMLITSRYDGHAYLFIYDAHTMEIMRQYKCMDGGSSSWCINPTIRDMELMYVSQPAIRVWNISTGKEKILKGTYYLAEQFDNMLVTVPNVQGNKEIHIYDTEAVGFKEVIGTSDDDDDYDDDNRADTELFHLPNDPTTVMTISRKYQYSTLKFWDVHSRSICKQVKLDGFYVGSIFMLTDDYVLVYNNNTRSYFTVDCTKGFVMNEIKSDYIKDVVVLKNHSQVVFRQDLKFQIFDYITGKLLHEYKYVTGSSYGAQHIMSAADGEIILLATTKGGQMKENTNPTIIFDVVNRKRISEIKFDEPVFLNFHESCCHLSEDGKYFFSQTTTNTNVLVWNISENKFERSLNSGTDLEYECNVGSVTCSSKKNCAILNYSTRYAISRAETTGSFLIAYDMTSWKAIAKIEIPENISAYELSHDHNRLLTKTWRDNQLQLYDISKLKEGEIIPVASLTLNSESYFCKLSSDGEVVFSSFFDGSGLTFFHRCGETTKESEKENLTVENKVVDYRLFKRDNI